MFGSSAMSALERLPVEAEVVDDQDDVAAVRPAACFGAARFA